MLNSLRRLRAPVGPVRITGLALLALAGVASIVHAVPDVDEEWQAVQPANDRSLTARHEAGAATVEGRLWLFGGRGNRPVEVFDPDTDSWRSAGNAPMELNHFQPAVIGEKVYLIGAFTGGYPNETSVADIHVFDTRRETWSIAGRVPAGRVRGSVATAVRDGWIYLIGGNTKGHNGGAVAWLDRWRAADGTWEKLPDAPHARDHFAAAFVADRLVVTGGRRTAQPDVFADLERETDIYDPTLDAWRAGKPLPTGRAGTVVIGYGGELIVAGGETATSSAALDVVEAYDIAADSWRTLQPMQQGRHSGGGALLDNRFHMVSGNRTRGGGTELDTHETLWLISERDGDEDGLSDDDEREIYSTDPALADTDGDALEDGDEVARGTDPLLADTDADGLNDGVEVADGTDPLKADSDDDALDDGTERTLGTDPNDPDTDDDTLLDGAEVATFGTDPREPDTDGDTLDDALELQIGTDPTMADTDGDGIGDALELQIGTDPTTSDTDGDGIDDGVERQLGTDPLIADNDDGSDDDGSDDTPVAAPRKGSGGGTTGHALLLGLLATAVIRRRQYSSAHCTLN